MSDEDTRVSQARKDEFLCCDIDKQSHEDCQIHGVLKPLDESLGVDYISKRCTKIPVPKQLRVKLSSIKDAGLGVFATEVIPKDTKMGPYKGVILQESEITPNTDCSYLWEVKQASGVSFYVDGRIEEESNWLRFVNCARYDEEQNLEAFQCSGNIYYCTSRDIMAGKELLIWYGNEFATKSLGLSMDCSTEVNNLTAESTQTVIQDAVVQSSNRTVDKSFHCDYCIKSFPSNYRLKRHMFTHRKEKLYRREHGNKQFYRKNHHSNATVCRLFRCKHCNKYFSNNYCLKRHMLIHTGKLHKCRLCNKSYSRRYLLASHLMKTHENIAQDLCQQSSLYNDTAVHKKVFYCEHCSKSFPTNSCLKRHILTHNKEKLHQCQHCSQSFSKKDYLVSHMKLHEKSGIKVQELYQYQRYIKSFSINIPVCKLFCCEYCKKNFPSDSRLKQHMLIHAKGKSHQCQHCSKTFSTKDHLVAHMKAHEDTYTITQDIHQCQHCRKSFSTLSYLKVHKMIHTGEKPYQCQHCGKSFSRRNVLKIHSTIHTGERPYQCQHCSKSFVTRYQLKLHNMVHTGVKPYQCHHCGKSFATNAKLGVHNRIHTGEKPFHCQLCNKSFYTNAVLKIHIHTVHERMRPYQCQYCCKSFCTNHNLEEHNRMHRRLYQCQYCNKCLSSSLRLKEHKRIHTGERPYKCHKCTKSFMHKSSYTRHIRKHDNENV